MFRKIAPEVFDNAVKLYRTGMTIDQVSSQLGIGATTISNALKQRGVKVLSRGDRFALKIDDAKVATMFNAGRGANGIAKDLGTSASVIHRSLLRSGLQPRNRSEQQRARMQNASPETIAKLTKRAHDAARGRKHTKEEKIKRAKSIEGRFHSKSKNEPIVFNRLVSHFPSAIPSKAVDIYNIDIAIDSIAVEIFGGGWSITDKRRLASYIKRTKKLGKLGFHCVFFIISKSHWANDTSQLISVINLARSLPAHPSQYWVVWGDSQGATGLCSKIDDSAFISPFVNVRDRTTGRYHRIAR